MEQPPSSIDRPRWGHGSPSNAALERVVAAREEEYVSWLELIGRFGEGLAAIDRGHRDDGEPCWGNELTSGLDGASIYCNVRDREPRRYMEVGSGYSTKFAARAVRDGDLATKVISIDPHPRSEVDALCDTVMRERLEETDLAIFDELEAGDVVFFDGSHRVFMNNDVTTFFLDVLPRIPNGVLVGVHDIYLPDDYFPEHVEMYWTEQYLLAMALIAAPERLPVVLPCHYMAVRPHLAKALNERWQAVGLAGVNAYGNALWFELHLALPAS